MIKLTTTTLARISVLALLAVAVSGCSVEDMQKMKVQDDLGEASRQASIGKIDGAKQWIGRAVKADPGAVATYTYTGKETDSPDALTIDMVLGDVGDYKDTEAYDRQAASRFPNDYHPLYALMSVQDTLGETAAEAQTAKALVSVLEARVAKGNIDGDVLTALGDAYWEAGNRQKALATYQRAMSIYVTHWPVYNHAAYQIAQANSKPDLAQALNYANIAIAQAQKQEAQDFQIAAIRDTLGWVEYRQGNYKQAAIDLNQALEVMPREPASRYHLAMVDIAQGDKSAAKSELNKALIIAPDYAEAKAAMETVKNAPALPTAEDLAESDTAP